MQPQTPWWPSGTLYPICWSWVPLQSRQPKEGYPYYKMVTELQTLRVHVPYYDIPEPKNLHTGGALRL